MHPVGNFQVLRQGQRKANDDRLQEPGEVGQLSRKHKGSSRIQRAAVEAVFGGRARLAKPKSLFHWEPDSERAPMAPAGKPKETKGEKLD